MFNDLSNYFVHNVIAGYKSYRTARSSAPGAYEHTRYAIEFATALFHFREHLPDANKATRTQIEQKCPDYRLIADVTNAAKHNVITSPTPQGPSLVSKAKDIAEETTIVQYTDSTGSYRHIGSQVLVKCSDGTERSLDVALVRVLNFWINELKILGVIQLDPAEEFVQPGSIFLSRDQASDVLDLQMTKSLAWSHRMRLLEFDNATQSAKPMDLTGAQVQMRVYQPKYTVNLTVSPPDGAEPFVIDLELTDEEAVEYHGLKNDEKRGAFAQKLFDARRDEVANKLRILSEHRIRNKGNL